MNPIPLSPIVRSLASLGKDSSHVADAVSRFSTCVRPVGVRLERIANQARSISAVGRDFSDVVQELEESPEQKQSAISFDIGHLEETVERCKAVLIDIETSISKATKRIATDPDYLDRFVELTRRERVAYGLTDEDLKIYSLRLRQGMTELRLQRELLVQQMLLVDPSWVATEHIESDSDYRQRERELSVLTKRLEEMGKVILVLKKPRERSEQKMDGHDLQLSSTEDVYRPSFAEVERLSESGRKLRTKPSYVRSRPQRHESRSPSALNPKTTNHSDSADSSNGQRDRNAMAQMTGLTSGQSQAMEVFGNHGGKSEKTTSGAATTETDHTPSQYVALQYNGFVRSVSTRGSPRREVIPASQDEISQLLDKQRKQGRDCSALTNHRLLRQDIQEDLNASLDRIRNQEPELEWTIRSIEIKKGGYHHLSRWRRQQSEQALVIFEGRPMDDHRGVDRRRVLERVLLTTPSTRKERQEQEIRKELKVEDAVRQYQEEQKAQMAEEEARKRSMEEEKQRKERSDKAVAQEEARKRYIQKEEEKQKTKPWGKAVDEMYQND
ncbi:MAG: hypothetical protein Q9181_007385 [Wetmoreana brouardii]